MTLIRQLRDLQEMDLNLERATVILRQIKSQLSDDPILMELEEVQQELATKQEELSKLEKEQRGLEWEVEGLSSKVSLIEEKLYGGTVGNPKELWNLQQEAEGLKSTIGTKEDRVLNLMAQVEVVQREITAREARQRELQEEWEHKKQLLLVESNRLEVTLAEDHQKRKTLVSEIDPPYLKLYEALREDKQGRAVVQIKQGRCQGCYITLPVNDIRHVKSESQPVQCSNCGRILYLS